MPGILEQLVEWIGWRASLPTLLFRPNERLRSPEYQAYEMTSCHASERLAGERAETADRIQLDPSPIFERNSFSGWEREHSICCGSL